MKLDDLLQQVFQQYGLLGLVIVFLIFGPGFTYFRTRTIRVEAEAKAQELLNEFVKQERLRADRLEKRLNETLRKLELAEDEVVQLRLRLSETQSDLDEVSKFKRQVRRLTRRVVELEEQVRNKQSENDQLRLEISQRNGIIQQNSQRIGGLEQQVSAGVANVEEKPNSQDL